MKVAIYSGSIPSTTFIEHIISGLSEQGTQVFLFGKCKNAYVSKSGNIHLYTTPVSNFVLPFYIFSQGLLLLFHNPRNLYVLCEYLKEKDRRWYLLGKYLPLINHLPDIFHVQWAKSAEEWVFLKELYGVKLVLSMRGSHINYSPICDSQLKQMFERVFPKYDAFHAVSNAIMLEGVKYGAGTIKNRVIYPAVEPSAISEIGVKSQNSPLKLLSVGRIHWVKGYMYSLDACRLLLQRRLSFHYTIVAGGKKEELIYQIHDLGIINYVTLLENLPHNEVFELIRESDIMLLPSVEEGVANVVLEAMAVGCPVISTNCGGMAEVIKDGYNGWLVPIRDSKALADAVTTVAEMSDEALYRVRQNAQRTINESHLLPKQVSEMISLYQNV